MNDTSLLQETACNDSGTVEQVSTMVVVTVSPSHVCSGDLKYVHFENDNFALEKLSH